MKGGYKMEEYTIQYRVVERPNGNLDVYQISSDERERLCYQNISKIGFVEILKKCIMC